MKKIIVALTMLTITGLSDGSYREYFPPFQLVFESDEPYSAVGSGTDTDPETQVLPSSPIARRVRIARRIKTARRRLKDAIKELNQNPKISRTRENDKVIYRFANEEKKLHVSFHEKNNKFHKTIIKKGKEEAIIKAGTSLVEIHKKSILGLIKKIKNNYARQKMLKKTKPEVIIKTKQ